MGTGSLYRVYLGSANMGGLGVGCEAYVVGDVNNDGEVNILDVVALVNIILFT